jgi:hypothetical protein
MRMACGLLILCSVWLLGAGDARAQAVPTPDSCPISASNCNEQFANLVGAANFTLIKGLVTDEGLTVVNYSLLGINDCFVEGVVNARTSGGVAVSIVAETDLNGATGTIRASGGLRRTIAQVDLCSAGVPPCVEFVDGVPTIAGSCDPILLDFGGFGFELTSAEDGVRFDLDADGIAEQVSWTRGGSRDAFLVRDLNGNGTIDDGGELFGNATRLSSQSFASDGYAVLADLDRPEQGGNGNGHLDRGDRAYPELLLWTDTNHDGISDPVELITLGNRGIVAIRTEAAMSPWTDEHGNAFALVSLAYLKNGFAIRPILTTDVFLVEAPR